MVSDPECKPKREDPYWLDAGQKEEKNCPSVTNSIAAPDKRIIKSHQEIRNVLHRGRRLSTRYGTFFMEKFPHTDFRFAVLIKKNVGHAVERNYCKRIVREYLRKNIHRFYPYHTVIFLYKYAGSVSYVSLQSEFDAVVKKIKK